MSKIEYHYLKDLNDSVLEASLKGAKDQLRVLLIYCKKQQIEWDTVRQARSLYELMKKKATGQAGSISSRELKGANIVGHLNVNEHWINLAGERDEMKNLLGTPRTRRLRQKTSA